MREIWMMQPRFDKRTGTSPFSLAGQPRFRAGFDFLRLRADVGEVSEELSDWWQEFSVADDGVRESMVEELRAEQQRSKKQQPRVHRVPKSAAAPTDSSQDAIELEAPSAQGGTVDGAATPAKKRRRRRRKPTGEGGPAAGAAD